MNFHIESGIGILKYFVAREKEQRTKQYKTLQELNFVFVQELVKRRWSGRGVEITSLHVKETQL